MSCRTRTNRTAFTLIELGVTIVILSVAALAITVRYRGVLATRGHEDALDRIRYIDAMARAAARRQDRPLSIEFDLTVGRILCVDPDTNQSMGLEESFDAETRLARLASAESSISSGRMALVVSRHGWTADYALAVERPSGQQEWIIFPGLTGASWQQTDEPQLPERQTDADAL